MGAAAVAIVGLALGLVDGISNGLYKGITGKEIRNRVAELRKLISKDTDLRNKLTDAYNMRNPTLMNNIISSVPGGLANKVATLEKAVKEQVHKHNITELDRNITQNQTTADRLEKIDMTNNSIENAVNQSHYDDYRFSNKLNPSHVDINKGEFEYTDLYGNKRKGNKESLNK